MTSVRDDVLDLFDHAWRRFRARMAGLGDDEWAWRPTPDERLTLRWRLRHIAELLDEERNGPWLGLSAGEAAGGADTAGADVPAGEATPDAEAAAPRPPAAGADSAEAALRSADAAYARWRGQLAALSDAALAAPVGPVGGAFAAATRRSFALHIADELIHHTAEAALLRDLYAGRG